MSNTDQAALADTVGEIADAIRATMISPNVCDKNMEPANVVDALDSVAGGLYAISMSLDKIADAIKERA